MNQPGFNQHIGQTIRPPSTALLTVDSEDRFPDYPTKRQTLGQYAAGNLVYNASPYYFTISKNESLMNGFFTRLAVTEVVFPWSIPNINNTCSSIYFNYNIAGGVSGETLIRVPTNFYNPSALAAFLQAEINTQVGALAGDFKMVYSPDPAIADAPLSFYYYSNGGANQYSFSPLPYNSLIYPYPATTKQLFDVLGFVNIRNTIFRTNTYGESSFAQSTRYVDICCSQLTYNQSLKDTSSQATVRDALVRVYLGDGGPSGTGITPPNASVIDAFTPPGTAPFVIYRNFTSPKQIQWTPNQPVSGYLVFEVYDDNGIRLDNLVSFADTGIDWSLTMQVTEN